MKQISLTLEKLLRNYNLWHGYEQYRLVQNWDTIVGTSLSAVTRAESLQNGILKVAVKDSVWAYHISMMKPNLKRKLNSFAGREMVNDIIFRVDEFEDK